MLENKYFKAFHKTFNTLKLVFFYNYNKEHCLKANLKNRLR